MKPPFPAVEGLYAKPTIVNNVESIANVTHVMRNGVDWYRSFGTEKSPGMRIFCLSGNVKYPGLYELPHATPLREIIYTYGGGPQEDTAPIKAIVPGGLSMKILTPDQMDTPMDYEAVAAAGSSLGSAGIIVIDDRTSMVSVARRTLSFYREESWQVHAVSRGHDLARGNPDPHGKWWRTRRTSTCWRASPPLLRQELLPVWRGLGVGPAK